MYLLLGDKPRASSLARARVYVQRHRLDTRTVTQTLKVQYYWLCRPPRDDVDQFLRIILSNIFDKSKIPVFLPRDWASYDIQTTHPAPSTQHPAPISLIGYYQPEKPAYSTRYALRYIFIYIHVWSKCRKLALMEDDEKCIQMRDELYTNVSGLWPWILTNDRE